MRPTLRIDIDVPNVGDEWLDSQPEGEWFDSQPQPEDDIMQSQQLFIDAQLYDDILDGAQPAAVTVDSVFDDDVPVPSVGNFCSLLKRSNAFGAELVDDDQVEAAVTPKAEVIAPRASDSQPTEVDDDDDQPLAEMLAKPVEGDDDVVVVAHGQAPAPSVPEPEVSAPEPEVPAPSVPPSVPAPPAPVVPLALPMPRDPEEQARLEQKRKVSREWHAKWIRAGVPRKQKTPSPQHSSDADGGGASGHSDGSGDGSGGAPPSEVPAPLPKTHAPRPDDDDVCKEAPGSGEHVSKVIADGTAAAAPDAAPRPNELNADGAAAKPPSFENLSKARDWYISDWISKCGMPKGNERRQAAVVAWMDSELRSSLVAGRKGITK